MRTRRARVIAIVAAAAVALALIITLAITRGQSETGTSVPEQPAATSQSLPPLTAERAAAIVAALNSSDKDAQAKVLAPELRSGEWDAKAVLPDGATLAIDPATFMTDKDGNGFVDGTVSGSVEVTFKLTLVYDGGQWLVAGTARR